MKKAACLQSLVVSAVLILAMPVVGQPPANDQCADAIKLTVYPAEADAIPVEGDTRNTIDGALANIPVCSANWYRDDVWYKLTANHPEGVRVYHIRVDYGDLPPDIKGVGLAVYHSCAADAGNQPIVCANEPAGDRHILCLDPGQEIVIRVWSAAGEAMNWQEGWGTFRISAFWGEQIVLDGLNVLWGDEPGQGDFDGGLNDWTVEGIQCMGKPAENALWTNTISGLPFYTFGPYGGITPIHSPTYCNGAMIWDGGLLHFGETGFPGSGDCPWDNHEGALISPVIDISDFDVKGVAVHFFQSMQRFNLGRHFLDYSLDGGDTWRAIEINSSKSYLSNNPATGVGYYNEAYRVPLPGAQGADSLRIRFRFSGMSYWWIIDDVRIVERSCDDVVTTDLFSMAPYGAWYCNQISDFALFLEVDGLAVCDSFDLVAEFEVRDEAGSLIYTQSMDFAGLPPEQLEKHHLFPTCANLPSNISPGKYFGLYTLKSQSLQLHPDFSTRKFEFVIDSLMMSLDVPGSKYFSGAPVEEGMQSYRVGAHYYIPNGVGYEVCDVSVGIGNTSVIGEVGGSLLLYFYEWADSNEDGIPQDVELNRLGFNQLFFYASDPDNTIYTIEILDEHDPNFGPCVSLKDNTHYLVVVEYITTFQDPDILLTLLFQDPAQPLLTGTSYAHTPPVSNGLGADCGPHFGAFYGVDELELSEFGVFQGGATPLMRIGFGGFGHIPCGLVGTEVVPLHAHIHLSPNPVSEVMQVNIDFGRQMDRVVLRITDVQGRVVMEETRSFMEQDSWIKPVSHMANGTYFLSITTEAGVRTERFVVQK